MAQFVVQFRGQTLALVFLGREQLHGQQPQFLLRLAQRFLRLFHVPDIPADGGKELDLALRVPMGQDHLGYRNFAAVPPADGAFPLPEAFLQVHRPSLRLVSVPLAQAGMVSS